MASPASSSDQAALREEVAAVQVHIKLVAPPMVWYDNPVTKLRERWENGELVDAMKVRTRGWNRPPNPWMNDNKFEIVPF